MGRVPFGRPLDPAIFGGGGVAQEVWPVTLFAGPNFTGESRGLGIGSHRFFDVQDFNDRTVSIKVQPGVVLIASEHADLAGGFGRSIDLLESIPDLAVFGFSQKISHVTVFSLEKPGYIWVRGAMTDGHYIWGHWERVRADGQVPPNAGPVVSPPLQRLPPQAVITQLQVNGPNTTITALGTQNSGEVIRWDYARTHLMGVSGNDFRGREEIGSAAFEREANSLKVPDWINFWYPQSRMSERGTGKHYKHTLAGKVKSSSISDIDSEFIDHDINLDVTPNPGFEYLISEAHPRHYSWIMEWQWKLDGSGKPNCDDADSIAEFSVVECEIQPFHEANSVAARMLNDMARARTGQDICVYGPWIYDLGHCCHPEIHPAEQIWWREDRTDKQRVYKMFVTCDGSKRFWWRDQMDDGVEMKPWGAPPIKGLFAIAFETEIGHPTAPGADVAPLTFEVANLDFNNVTEIPGANQTYTLTYQGRVLVQFKPNNSAFKVSFENVGSNDGKTVRGFLVIETTVGTVRQKSFTPYAPKGVAPEMVPQSTERQIFEKKEGHYFFTVTETSRHPLTTDSVTERLARQPTRKLS